MPSAYDLQEFHRAIKKNDCAEISNFLKRDDVKKLLLTWHSECLPIHVSCERNLDEASLRLILDAAVEHEIIKEMLEANNRDRHTCLHLACEYKLSTCEHYAYRSTCLHYACRNKLSTDSLLVLLEYLSKHADIKKVLEEKDNDGSTCLHFACVRRVSIDFLRLLLEYLAKHADIKKMLEEKTEYGLTCLHNACLHNACLHNACEEYSFDSMCLLLEYLAKHADIKKMIEKKDEDGWTCLHSACRNKLSTDSFRLLLEYSSKYADIKKKLEAKTSAALRGGDYTCLHYACSKNVLTSAMSTDCLRLLLDYLFKYADIKKVLEEIDESGNTCLYSGSSTLATDSLRLLLDYFSKHADIKKVLEDKNVYKRTCLHLVCDCGLSTDSHRLLFEYLFKYADVKNMVEEKDKDDKTCLHFACDNSQFPTDSLRLLISFFPSNESLQRALNSKTCVAGSKIPVEYASKDEHKQLLRDPDCWQKCRYWLLCNHQETFLNTLYPNSPEQTLGALKELSKSYADDENLKKAIAELELSALRKENEELKKKVEVLEQENKQVKEERILLMKQLYAGFG